MGCVVTINTYCGYITIIGRTNVGKSTLMNAILGQKLSITSKKVQTTRHKILGIKTQGAQQFIYLDTPGFHDNMKRVINHMMSRVAETALHDADIILFMMSIHSSLKENEKIISKLKPLRCPVVLVINKIDLLDNKQLLLPKINILKQQMHFAKVIPISAKKKDYVVQLEQELIEFLPSGPHLFAENQLTDRSEAFIISEIIREKLLHLVSDELPYTTAVVIEEIKNKARVMHINAVIWVEREGQKAIVIGRGGEMLKKIGCRARLVLEKRYDRKIFLSLWVKVKPAWGNKEIFLRQLGIGC